jgi:RimJ/RimL family protein N-acetyltransferase
MADPKKSIPKNTLETLARNMYKETSSYGFQQADYVRFVNMLLDYSMQNENRKDEMVKIQSQSKQKIARALKGAKPISLPIRGERIIIRELDMKKDKPLFEEWLKDPFGRYFLLSRYTATSMDLNDFFNHESNIIGVITLHDGRPIGSMAYLEYDVTQFKAELRKLIGDPTMRGKGLAKEATALWLEYGAVTLDLRKIYLNTFNTNIRNIKLNEELGFRVEGILRNEMFFEGKFKDILRMGYFRE